MSKSKRQLIGKGLVCLSIALALLSFRICSGPSEKSLRSRVVMLKGNGSLCSGEQVKAPSGKDYILSAGHCNALADKSGNIEVVTEDGKHLQRRIIQEDPRSDLLLIEGLPNTEGIEIAKSSHRSQHIRTFTHGKGLKTYKTEGDLIEDQHLNIMLSIGDEEKCDMPKEKKMDMQIFIFQVRACVLSVDETITNAMIVPGSSGGMAVDNSGKLVGVCSASAGEFGALVRLSDIRAFLSNY